MMMQKVAKFTALFSIGFLVGFITFDNISPKEEPVIFTKQKLSEFDTVKVSVTSYNATIAQCDSNPTQTSSGYIITNDSNERIIAVSRDLLDWYVNYNDVVIIQGTNYDGEYIVKDKMNGRYSNYVDICLPINKKGGLWKNCKLLIKRKI